MGMEDERVAQLEHRMNQLEVNMQQQQHVAASQHAEVQQQLNQVRIQVDQQGASFRSLMDQRFTEQLSEIERIMAKRPKTTE
jgi:flagellar biosynthesis chaperone FliJ